MSDSAGGFGYFGPAPTMVTCGLPPPPDGPENSGEWYHEALQMPETHVRGWFGCVIGSEKHERQDDVTLFFHDGNHLEPKLRLVMSSTDLMAVFAAIGNVLHTRLGLLKEWELRQLSPTDALDS